MSLKRKPEDSHNSPGSDKASFPSPLKRPRIDINLGVGRSDSGEFIESVYDRLRREKLYFKLWKEEVIRKRSRVNKRKNKAESVDKQKKQINQAIYKDNPSESSELPISEVGILSKQQQQQLASQLTSSSRPQVRQIEASSLVTLLPAYVSSTLQNLSASTTLTLSKSSSTSSALLSATSSLSSSTSSDKASSDKASSTSSSTSLSSGSSGSDIFRSPSPKSVFPYELFDPHREAKMFTPAFDLKNSEFGAKNKDFFQRPAIFADFDNAKLEEAFFKLGFDSILGTLGTLAGPSVPAQAQARAQARALETTKDPPKKRKKRQSHKSRRNESDESGESDDMSDDESSSDERQHDDDDDDDDDDDEMTYLFYNEGRILNSYARQLAKAEAEVEVSNPVKSKSKTNKTLAGLTTVGLLTKAITADEEKSKHKSSSINVIDRIWRTTEASYEELKWPEGLDFFYILIHNDCKLFSRSWYKTKNPSSKWVWNAEQTPYDFQAKNVTLSQDQSQYEQQEQKQKQQLQHQEFAEFAQDRNVSEEFASTEFASTVPTTPTSIPGLGLRLWLEKMTRQDKWHSVEANPEVSKFFNALSRVYKLIKNRRNKAKEKSKSKVQTEPEQKPYSQSLTTQLNNIRSWIRFHISFSTNLSSTNSEHGYKHRFSISYKDSVQHELVKWVFRSKNWSCLPNLQITAASEIWWAIENSFLSNYGQVDEGKSKSKGQQIDQEAELKKNKLFQQASHKLHYTFVNPNRASQDVDVAAVAAVQAASAAVQTAPFQVFTEDFTIARLIQKTLNSNNSGSGQQLWDSIKDSLSDAQLPERINRILITTFILTGQQSLVKELLTCCNKRPAKSLRPGSQEDRFLLTKSIQLAYVNLLLSWGLMLPRDVTASVNLLNYMKKAQVVLPTPSVVTPAIVPSAAASTGISRSLSRSLSTSTTLSIVPTTDKNKGDDSSDIMDVKTTVWDWDDVETKSSSGNSGSSSSRSMSITRRQSESIEVKDKRLQKIKELQELVNLTKNGRKDPVVVTDLDSDDEFPQKQVTKQLSTNVINNPLQIILRLFINDTEIKKIADISKSKAKSVKEMTKPTKKPDSQKTDLPWPELSQWAKKNLVRIFITHGQQKDLVQCLTNILLKLTIVDNLTAPYNYGSGRRSGGSTRFSDESWRETEQQLASTFLEAEEKLAILFSTLSDWVSKTDDRKTHVQELLEAEMNASMNAIDVDVVVGGDDDGDASTTESESKTAVTAVHDVRKRINETSSKLSTLLYLCLQPLIPVQILLLAYFQPKPQRLLPISFSILHITQILRKKCSIRYLNDNYHYEHSAADDKSKPRPYSENYWFQQEQDRLMFGCYTFMKLLQFYLSKEHEISKREKLIESTEETEEVGLGLSASALLLRDFSSAGDVQDIKANKLQQYVNHFIQNYDPTVLTEEEIKDLRFVCLGSYIFQRERPPETTTTSSRSNSSNSSSSSVFASPSASVSAPDAMSDDDSKENDYNFDYSNIIPATNSTIIVAVTEEMKKVRNGHTLISHLRNIVPWVKFPSATHYYSLAKILNGLFDILYKRFEI